VFFGAEFLQSDELGPFVQILILFHLTLLRLLVK
jgi:hypothetical protein